MEMALKRSKQPSQTFLVRLFYYGQICDDPATISRQIYFLAANNEIAFPLAVGGLTDLNDFRLQSGGINSKIRGRCFASQMKLQIGADAMPQ